MKLKGKTVFFLGSSITEGPGGVSFAEMMAEECDFTCVKEAVSGTTLADIAENSYVARLKKADPSLPVDLFICQLSTNDGYAIQRGKTTFAKTEEAIRFILAYAAETWHCPVVFYTSPQFDHDVYPQMVELLYSLRKEYDFTILDLWNDPEMCAVSPEDHARYMNDPCHPNLVGYKEWWTPKFVAHCTAL